MRRKKFYNTEKIPEEDINSNSLSDYNINKAFQVPKTYSYQNSNVPISDNNKSELTIYSKFVEDVINEINFVRTKPSEYAAKLERICSSITGHKVKVGNSIMKLREGSKIFDESIQYLLNIGPMEPLELCDGLSESANELLSILIIQEGVDMSEFSLDIYDLEHRLDHFGVFFGEFNEIIDYGSFDAEFVVVNFILGDGDETRTDRHTILNPQMKYCGIASGILPSTKKCTVLNVVQHYYKPGEEIPDKILQNYTYRPSAKDQFKKLNGKIGEIFFDKRNKYNQKYNIDSYTFINDANGKVNGKKPKKIKKITKKFRDKNTGREIVTVKTIITYMDGEEVTDTYAL
jgi:hypothetical protein